MGAWKSCLRLAAYVSAWDSMWKNKESGFATKKIYLMTIKMRKFVNAPEQYSWYFSTEEQAN